MRLQPKEITAVTQAAQHAFIPGTGVFLFGSRVDDAKRGGDIDLLVELPASLPAEEWVRRRSRFVTRLYRLLDEQRIDVVMTAQDQPDARSVVARAKREGIKLVQV